MTTDKKQLKTLLKSFLINSSAIHLLEYFPPLSQCQYRNGYLQHNT